jgi:hypothetical protein
VFNKWQLLILRAYYGEYEIPPRNICKNITVQLNDEKYGNYEYEIELSDVLNYFKNRKTNLTRESRRTKNKQPSEISKQQEELKRQRKIKQREERMRLKDIRTYKVAQKMQNDHDELKRKKKQEIKKIKALNALKAHETLEDVIIDEMEFMTDQSKQINTKKPKNFDAKNGKIFYKGHYYNHSDSVEGSFFTIEQMVDMYNHYNLFDGIPPVEACYSLARKYDARFEQVRGWMKNELVNPQ